MNSQLSSHIEPSEVSEQLDIDFQQDQLLGQDLEQPPPKVGNQSTEQPLYQDRSNESELKTKCSKQQTTSLQEDKKRKFRELRRCLQTLKEELPEMFNEEFVDTFYIKVYDKIYHQNPTNKRVAHPKRQPFPKRQKYQPSRPQISQRKYQPINNRPVSNQNYREPILNSNYNFQGLKTQQQTRCIQNELQMQNIQADTLKLQETGYIGQIIDQATMIQIAKVVASVFCQKGFNPVAIEEQIVLKNLSPYKNQINFFKILSHIVYNAYEFLYKFLVQQCKKQYIPLVQNFGQQFLISYLINCSKNMQAQTCQIFYKIIRGQWNLSSQQLAPAPDNALKLYHQLQRKMTALRRKQKYFKLKKQSTLSNDQLDYPSKSRVHDPRRMSRRMLNAIERAPHPKQIDEVNRLNRVWNSRYQSEMISAYKEGKTISQITDYFKDIFPKDRDAFSSVAIRSQLYKILRKALKKFYTLINKYGSKRLPEVKKLNHYEVRAIIYNNDGIEVRMQLLDVYLIQNYDQRLIIDTIKEIIKYVGYLETIQKKDNLYSTFAEEKQPKMTPMTTKSKLLPYNPRGMNGN